MQDFRKVDAWNKAHQLVLQLYHATQSIPRDEIFGITMLLRRCSINIASRIAEGCGRSNSAEFASDLRKAAAATNELEYQILLAKDLGHWNGEMAEKLSSATVEVRKMTYGLIRSLN